jgi:hypothetical protein
VEITESPIKEIIVHEVYKVGLESLVIKILHPDGVPTYLHWCDGILYHVSTLGGSKGETEYLKGKFHFIEMFYTEMPQYRSIVEVSTEQFGGLKVSVVNESDIPLHKELIKWLKGRKTGPKRKG